ncbi:MAG: hypothetical protein PHG83_00700 [Patescibacteria group bacterium]|nr:hypothetical protein [Patescibacteria group bacterium]
MININPKPTRLGREKPTVAIISLTACNGCLMEIINLGQLLKGVVDRLQITEFPLVRSGKSPTKFDIAFIEGSVVTKENLKTLEQLRKQSKFLIAIGACACIGGIPEIKNYRDREKLIKQIYKSTKNIENPLIKPLKEYVKIDLEIPGCPPNKKEIAKIIASLLVGKIPCIPQRPVCYECQIREYNCLLQKGLPCLGSITLGGCQAVCLKSGEICSACRGFLSKPAAKNLIKIFKKQGLSDQDLNNLLEKFGVRDEFEKILKS